MVAVQKEQLMPPILMRRFSAVRVSLIFNTVDQFLVLD